MREHLACCAGIRFEKLKQCYENLIWKKKMNGLPISIFTLFERREKNV